MKLVKYLFVIIFMPMILFAQHWTEDYRLTQTPLQSITSFNNARCIALGSESIIHTVWTEEGGPYPNQYGVYYCRSFDYGISWTGILDLYAHSGTSASSPSIAVFYNNVHVVFVVARTIGSFRGKIYYMKSTDGGYYWSSPEALTSDWDNCYPAITVSEYSPQYINIAWQTQTGLNFSIRTVQSPNGGTSWGTITTLATQEEHIGAPSITSEGQIIHATWNRYRRARTYVVYSKSNDFGANWIISYDLPGSADINGMGAPSISAFASNVHIVWSYFRLTERDYRIKHLMSQNSGDTWSEMNILASTGIYSCPTVTIDQSNIVHLVWKDGDGIYYLRSLDAGINWQEPTRIVLSGYPNNPSIANTHLNAWNKINGIYLVWTDERDGNKEIYFKRGWQIGDDATFPNQARHLVRVVNTSDLITVFQGDKAVFSQSLGGNCPPPTPMLIYTPIGLAQGNVPSIAVNSGGSSWICYATTDQPQKLNCLIQRNQNNWKEMTLLETDSVFAPSLVLATPIFGTPQNMGFVVYTTYENDVYQIRFSAFDSLQEQPYYTTIIDEGNVSAPSIAVTPGEFIHIVWRKDDRILYITAGKIHPEKIRQGFPPAWSDIVPISTQVPLTEPATNPFVEAQGERVFVVWRGPNAEGNSEFGEIWQREGRIQPGQLPEWRDPRNVSNTPLQESNYPTMSTGTAVVWQESLSNPPRYQIYGSINGIGQIVNLSNNQLNCKYPHTNLMPTEPWYRFRWRLLTVWTQEKLPGIYQIEYGHYDFDRRKEELIAVEVDAGKIIPSKYLIERLGYIDYGDYSVDYAFELIYKLCYLHPEKYYLLEAICYNNTEATEKFVFEDNATKTIQILPSDPETLRIMLRPNHYEDAECLLKIRKLIGEYAVLAKMYLYEFEMFEEGGSGPQSSSAYDNYDFIPSTSLLHIPIPNPFKNRLLIQYQLSKTSKVSLSIYDVQGRLIRTLTNETYEPGIYEQVWDVRDNKGRKVPTGVYFYRLATDDETAVNKVVLTR